MNEQHRNAAKDWLILAYKVPSEPTRYRASVWRKLKASGAIYLQDGVATLPEDSTSERVMRGIVQEIRQVQGTAYFFRSTPIGDDTALVAAYNSARDEEYEEVLEQCRDFHSELRMERDRRNLSFAELEENEEDLHKLEVWLDKVKARDRFGTELRAEAEQALVSCHEDLEEFASQVYEFVDSQTSERSQPATE